jgi:ganglioside-induced differentiation-associated protein 1
MRIVPAKIRNLQSFTEARANVFAERIRIFNPEVAAQLASRCRAQATDIIDRMEGALGDGRATLIPPTYGIVDTIMTVFLSRMEFIGLGAQLTARPALLRYWRAMQTRPSFTVADVWTRMHIVRMISASLGLAGT